MDPELSPERCKETLLRLTDTTHSDGRVGKAREAKPTETMQGVNIADIAEQVEKGAEAFREPEEEQEEMIDTQGSSRQVECRSVDLERRVLKGSGRGK